MDKSHVSFPREGMPLPETQSIGGNVKNKPQNLESFGKNRIFPPPTEAPGLWLPPLRKELKRTKSSRNYREGLHESKSELSGETEREPHETKSEFWKGLHEIKSEFGGIADTEPHEIKSEFREWLHETESESAVRGRDLSAGARPPAAGTALR